MMYNAHIFVDYHTHIKYNNKNRKGGFLVAEYTEKQLEQRRKAVRRYEQNNYRLNIVFPKGTKERIENLNLDKTNSAFIRDTVLSKLEELEKILK